MYHITGRYHLFFFYLQTKMKRKPSPQHYCIKPNTEELSFDRLTWCCLRSSAADRARTNVWRPTDSSGRPFWPVPIRASSFWAACRPACSRRPDPAARSRPCPVRLWSGRSWWNTCSATGCVGSSSGQHENRFFFVFVSCISSGFNCKGSVSMELKEVQPKVNQILSKVSQ